MKKIIAGAAGALLMSGGLVAATGATAQAVPYPGTVATTVTVTTPGEVKRKKRADVCASVAAASGTALPTGTVRITVSRNVNGNTVDEVVYNYAGGQVCLKTQKLVKTGGYTVRASYVSRAGTVFTDSSNSGGFDVVAKDKRR